MQVRAAVRGRGGRGAGLEPPALSPRKGQKSLPGSYLGLVGGTVVMMTGGG